MVIQDAYLVENETENQKLNKMVNSQLSNSSITAEWLKVIRDKFPAQKAKVLEENFCKLLATKQHRCGLGQLLNC
jgi:hypothetical protein